MGRKIKIVENCIRIYDDVISKHWCEDTIKSFEETSTDRYSNGHKEFNQLEIWDQPEWHDTKLKFLNLMQTSMVKFMEDVKIDTSHFPQSLEPEHITIKKYTDNGKDQFAEHVDVTDSVHTAKRFLVFILYLNDCKGGETYIPRYNISSQPKQGRLLMFPPFWTHPHMGKKVQKGNKYVMMSYLRMK